MYSMGNYVPKQSGRQKLDDKSEEMCFVGYISDKGIYKVYDPTNGRFSTARDVIFDEKKFFAPNQLLAFAKRATPPLDDVEAINLSPPRIIHDEIVVMPRPSRTIIPPDTVTEGELRNQIWRKRVKKKRYRRMTTRRKKRIFTEKS